MDEITLLSLIEIEHGLIHVEEVHWLEGLHLLLRRMLLCQKSVCLGLFLQIHKIDLLLSVKDGGILEHDFSDRRVWFI